MIQCNCWKSIFRKVCIMDYKQAYEILLKTICENDKRMLQLLAQINCCDDALLEISLQDAPNPAHLQAINMKKERLIQQLENLSAAEEKYAGQLNSIASLCNEVTSHPLYTKMNLLHTALCDRMKLVLHKEDCNNPLITQQLENYQEKLEMDIRISEVPMEKRHIFYLYPHK